MDIGVIPHYPAQRSIWPRLLWCHSTRDNVFVIFLGMDWASEVSTDPMGTEVLENRGACSVWSGLR